MKLEKQQLEQALRQSNAMLQDAELTTALMHNQIAYINKRLNRIKVEEQQTKDKQTTQQTTTPKTDDPATSNKV